MSRFFRILKRIIFAVSAVYIAAVVCIVLMQEYVLSPTAGTRHIFYGNNAQVTDAYVRYTLSGKGGNVTAAKADGEINSSAGSKQSAADIEVQRRRFTDAEISFRYNEKGLGSEEENLKIAYFNEDSRHMELLEDSTVDADNNTVSIKTTKPGRYVVVDSKEWYEQWTKSQLLIRDLSAEKKYFDVAVVIDSSSSMAAGDKSRLSKESAYSFIQNLYGGDYYALYDFDDKAHLIADKIMHDDTLSWSSIRNAIMKTDTDGGTNIDSAIDAAIENFSYPEKDCVSIEILLTDGQSAVSEEKLRQAREQGIKIITIGFGEDVDEDVLINAANSTGGKYYRAGTKNISEIFDEIRQAYMGTDTTEDTDGDGIPDIIETSGIRNAYGRFIVTDPEKADTDDDGISDGAEIGTLTEQSDVTDYDKENNLGQYVYFTMPADPTVYDENRQYNPKVSTEHTVSVSEDKTSVDFTFDIKNMAALDSVLDSGNVINALNNCKATVTLPECCTSDSGNEYSIGNLASGDVYSITGHLTHDPAKCSGEKHIIGLKIQSDNLKDIYDEIRVDGLYWFEDEDIKNNTAYSEKLSIIQTIRRYTRRQTTDPFRAESEKAAALLNPNLTPEQRRAITESRNYAAEILRSTAGVKGSLEYIENNDNFLSSKLRDYFAQEAADGTLSLSDLIIDETFRDITQEEEKEKYKASLLSFIAQDLPAALTDESTAMTEELRDGESAIIDNLLSATDSDKTLSKDDKQKLIDDLRTYEEKLYFASDYRLVADVAESLAKYVSDRKNESPEMKAVLDKVRGYEKSFNINGKTLKINSDTIELLSVFSEYSINEEVYKSYADLLSIIAQGSTDKPLKDAAAELSTVFSDRLSAYQGDMLKLVQKNASVQKAADNAGETLVFDKSKILLVMADIPEFFEKYDTDSFIQGLTGDKSADTKDLSECAADLITYAESSDILVQSLKQAEDEFNAAYIKDIDSAYLSAVKYRNIYNFLTDLRRYSEEAYYTLTEEYNDVLTDYMDKRDESTGESGTKETQGSSIKDPAAISRRIEDDESYLDVVRSNAEQTREQLSSMRIK